MPDRDQRMTQSEHRHTSPKLLRLIGTYSFAVRKNPHINLYRPVVTVPARLLTSPVNPDAPVSNRHIMSDFRELTTCLLKYSHRTQLLPLLPTRAHLQ